MNGNRVLDISWGTILKIGIGVLGFYVLYLIRDILIWLIFALIISILFNPTIDFLQRRRIPRVVAVVLVYLFAFGLISFIIYSIIPLFISEISNFSQVFPQYFEKISPPLKGLGLPAFENLENFLNVLGGNLEKMAANIFNTLFAIFGGIFSTIFVLTVALFLSLEEKAVERALILLFPKKYEAYALSLWEKCEKKVGGWFLSRILGCLFVGALSYITFLLFNTKYAFSLGLLAAITNFIPVVGPIIAGVVIFIIVSLDNFLRGIFVLLIFILIQQIENNILTPLLSKKFIGLSPILVLLSIAIGGVLWGILGAILAIPLFGILFEFLRDFLKKRKEERPIVI